MKTYTNDTRSFDYQVIAMRDEDNFLSGILSWRELLKRRPDLFPKPIADPSFNLCHQGLADPQQAFRDAFGCSPLSGSGFPTAASPSHPLVTPPQPPPQPPSRKSTSGGRIRKRRPEDEDEAAKTSGESKKKLSEKERLKRNLRNFGFPEEGVEGLCVRALKEAVANEKRKQEQALSGSVGCGDSKESVSA